MSPTTGFNFFNMRSLGNDDDEDITGDMGAHDNQTRNNEGNVTSTPTTANQQIPTIDAATAAILTAATVSENTNVFTTQITPELRFNGKDFDTFKNGKSVQYERFMAILNRFNFC
jgi:hypothetical protein